MRVDRLRAGVRQVHLDALFEEGAVIMKMMSSTSITSM